jgi:hypothetical protein
VSAIESWLSIAEPQPRMGFSPNIGNNRKGTSILRVPFFLCQQCVPEPASQVHLSVVSDICKANIGCGSAKHSSKLDDSSLALHDISDEINSPEIPRKSRSGISIK